ncbi:MAG TPA: hypothetical protein VG537_04530, partial [Candidatus Kapabacteria bacterium]|nr:hypothetical protein [Candidatus Kapabacteria bacterium]
CGYGEMTYKDPNNGDVPRLNLPRIVLYIDHDFSSKWVFKSEFEVEDVKIERGVGGEIGFEQAFLDYHANNTIGWRAGLILIPMGIINQTHEPTTFYSVERPLFDQQVIPTTWREIGTGIYGNLSESIEYQLYITEGLKASDITMDGTDGAKQEGSAGEAASDAIAGSDASHPAISGKIEYLPFAGLRLGASAYMQPNAFKTPNTPTDVPGSLLVGAIDARYEHGPLHIRGEAGIVNSGDASNYIDVPYKIAGGYIEAAYNVMPFFTSAPSELLPFARYESFSFTGPSVIAGDTATGLFSIRPTVNHMTITAGLAFKPLDGVILKSDYRITKVEGSPIYRQFSVGGGFAF